MSQARRRGRSRFLRETRKIISEQKALNRRLLSESERHRLEARSRYDQWMGYLSLDQVRHIEMVVTEKIAGEIAKHFANNARLIDHFSRMFADDPPDWYRKLIDMYDGREFSEVRRSLRREMGTQEPYVVYTINVPPLTYSYRFSEIELEKFMEHR